MRGSYQIHGVGLEVRSENQAVLDAIDLRLRDFATGDSLPAGTRFEFVAGGRPRASLPAGPRRPVYDTPHGSLHYFPDADALCGNVGGVWLRCEAERGVALFESDEFIGQRLYLAAHPLATISLMETLERRGLFSLHAACLAGTSGKGVLLSGPSGSGKSTLALALAHAGMGFLSDDVVFVAADAQDIRGSVRVLGFADTIGLPDYPGPFAEISSRLDGRPADGFPKRVRRFEELFGTPALKACEPCAIVFPQVAPDRPSELSRLDPGDALVRLVPDVLLTDPAATQAHLRAIAALLDQVECYALLSGTDLERAAELVRALV